MDKELTELEHSWNEDMADMEDWREQDEAYNNYIQDEASQLK